MSLTKPRTQSIEIPSGRDPLALLKGASHTTTTDEVQPPEWVPDHETKHCQFPECKVVFTFTNRRHHCRFCGGIFCNKCSRQAVMSKAGTFAGKPQRICTPCYDRLTEVAEEEKDELLKASEAGDIERVAHVLDTHKKINIEHKDDFFQMTSLFVAAKAGHERMVQFLLDRGATINTMNKYFQNSLFAPIRKGYLPVIQTLIKGGIDVNCIDRDSDFPLLLACGRHSTGSADMVRALLKAGARVHQEDKLGENALRAAAASGLVEVARVLLDHGAEVNGYNSEKKMGLPPLAFAAAEGKLAMVQFLISRGADVNLGCPLFYAAEVGHTDVLDVLIKAKANLNRFPSIGRDERTAYSPLMAAIERGHMEAVLLLLDRGASVNIENDAGWTPLMVAVAKWRVEMLRLLLDRGAAPDVSARNPDTGAMFLEQAAQIQFRRYHAEYEALHRAAFMQRPSIVGTPPVHIGHGLANSIDFDAVAAAQRARDRGSATAGSSTGSSVAPPAKQEAKTATAPPPSYESVARR